MPGGITVRRCSEIALTLAAAALANPSWIVKPRPGLSRLVKGSFFCAKTRRRRAVGGGRAAPSGGTDCPNGVMDRDSNSVEQFEVNCVARTRL